MKDTVLVVGCGAMGFMQAKLWHKLGFNVVVMDTEDQGELWSTTSDSHMVSRQVDRRKDVEAFGGKFSLLPPGIDGQKEMISTFLREHPGGILNISSSTDTHVAFLEVALESGAERIMLEKPVSQKVSEVKEALRLDERYDTPVAVNYIDRANIAVIAVLGFMKEKNWAPTRAFFRREHDVVTYVQSGKSPDDQPWTTLRDLSHDLSILSRFRKDVYGSCLSVSDIVVRANMRPWRDIYKESCAYDTTADLSSASEIRFSDGLVARIHGRKNAYKEQRCFVAFDDNQALFVTTLDRKLLGIRSCAFRVRDHVATADILLHMADPLVGFDHNFEALQKFFEGFGGEEIPLDLSKANSQANIFENLISANSKEDLICSLKDGCDIDLAVEAIYESARKGEQNDRRSIGSPAKSSSCEHTERSGESWSNSGIC